MVLRAKLARSVRKDQSEIKTVPLEGKMITLENLTPKELERRKHEIEKRLFDMFSKYEEKPPQ